MIEKARAVIAARAFCIVNPNILAGKQLNNSCNIALFLT